MDTINDIQQLTLEKRTAHQMLENARRMVIDDTVKIKYYEFIASKIEDKQEKAQWLVQADKTKVSKRAIEESLIHLEPFVESYN